MWIKQVSFWSFRSWLQEKEMAKNMLRGMRSESSFPSMDVEHFPP
jgi:hypothetical protein